MSLDAPPAHLSYSSFSTLLECGEKWRLQRIARVPESPAWYFLGGTAVHTATERYDLGEVGHPDPATDLFLMAFDEEIAKAPRDMPIRASGRPSKDWPDGENEAWWRHHGPKFVQAYIDWREAHPELVLAEFAGRPAVEIEVMCDIAGVLLKGFVDRVFADTTTGELMVVDLKTGKNTPMEWQLQFYGIALRKTLGVPVEWGAYWMARQGHLSIPARLWADEELIGDWLGKAKQMIDLGLFVPHVTSFCNSCTVREHCTAFQR